ncbi:hypothetical protein [Escherichia coli]
MGVVKLADYRPQLEVVEHRVADTEDGFMRIANEIIRAFVHQAKPFYFGDNDTGWTADFDYLLREDSLTGVREA